MDVHQSIGNVIDEHTRDPKGKKLYRRPLIGCSDAQDPLFLRLPEVTHPGHLQPGDLLSGAKSVVAFFLPFTGEIIRGNRRGDSATRLWAETYAETNRRIDRIQAGIRETLAADGIACAHHSPTGGFDQHRLMATWSHRHAAYICGLGTFGRSNLLITPAGCAGRVGTVVLDFPLKASPRPAEEHCLHRRGLPCSVCLDRCPVGAISPGGFDRHRCYEHLQEAEDMYPDITSAAACGKCSLGPCASRIPGGRRGSD